MLLILALPLYCPPEMQMLLPLLVVVFFFFTFDGSYLLWWKEGKSNSLMIRGEPFLQGLLI